MEITVLKAITKELVTALPGLKLVELKEGVAGEISLVFKGPGARHALAINPRPGLPRVHLSSKRPPAARESDPFAQGLKNHILGSELVSVGQEGLERVVLFHFTRKKKESSEKSVLALEFAGKKPGLILMDGAGKVLLAQSYVSISDESPRPVLPGLAYRPPPLPDKLDPHRLIGDNMEKIIRDNPGIPPGKALFKGVGGISPQIAAEAVFLAGPLPTPTGMLKSLNSLLARVESGPYEPCIYQAAKGAVLAAIPLSHLGVCPRRCFASMSEAAECFYEGLIAEREFKAAKDTLLRAARAKLVAAERKLSAIESDIRAAGMAEDYRKMGQLLIASLNLVPRDAEEVTLPDLFSRTGESATIPLDPALTAVENAEAYFRKAKKARAGAAVLAGRLKAAREELEAQRALVEAVERTEGLEGLRGITGVTPPRGAGARVSRKPAGGLPEFPSFVSSDGYQVLYAKNARLNDILTFKVAEPMDLWLHAQGYHGAHVVVRNPERRPDIPLNTIIEAAEVAAFYSGAKKDKSVAVDYTFKKYVRKPRAPVPGQAIFTGNKTVFVEPRKRGG